VPEVAVTVARIDQDMNSETRKQVLEKLRRRYRTAGAEHKRKLIDQAVQLLGYHRKSAIRSLRRLATLVGPVIVSGRPVSYELRTAAEKLMLS
jgi:hypothetical protein